MQFPGRHPLRILTPIVVAAGIVLTQPAFAGDVIVDPIHEYRDEVGRGEFKYDDSQDIPWIENETEVLGLPKPEDLIRVDLDQLPPGIDLMVDKSRIAVNPEDKVVRVWLWLQSSSGAENGSFEGFRCETREYKVYAFGSEKRTPPVTKAKKPLWRDVKTKVSRNYRKELMDDYFCGYGESRDASEIRRYLTGDLQGEPIFADW